MPESAKVTWLRSSGRIAPNGRSVRSPQCGSEVVAAGIYTTCSPDEIAYVLRHAESKVLIAENLEQLAKVEEIWDDVPDLIRVVLMDGSSDDQRVMSWDEFLASAEGTPDSEIDSRLDRLRDDQLAVFIYTSGTTGPPKAVMLTHENISWTAHTIGTPFDTDADVVSLSYLPLSHIAEMTGSILAAVTFGYTVYFCHDGLQLAEYLKEVARRPSSAYPECGNESRRRSRPIRRGNRSEGQDPHLGPGSRHQATRPQ